MVLSSFRSNPSQVNYYVTSRCSTAPALRACAGQSLSCRFAFAVLIVMQNVNLKPAAELNVMLQTKEYRMYYLIFLFASILLAIPTYGISIIVFLVLKNWADNVAAKAILNSAITSLTTGEAVLLYHVNKAAIRKVFNAIGLEPCVEEVVDQDASTSFSGPVNHPGYARTMLLCVIYTVRSGSKNTIIVKAEDLHFRKTTNE